MTRLLSADKGVSNILLSIAEGESVLVLDAADNSLRCVAWSLARQFGRHFSINRENAAHRVTRLTAEAIQAKAAARAVRASLKEVA